MKFVRFILGLVIGKVEGIGFSLGEESLIESGRKCVRDN